MNVNFLSLCLIGISIFFVTKSVAHEAIINGDRAEVDQFPYQVALLELSNGTEFCGGGIINERYVLSAAHCFGDEKNFIEGDILVVAGTNDYRSRHKPAETVEVAKIFVPIEYKPTKPFHTADIAVVKLKHPLKLSQHIKKLELPKHKDETFHDKTAKIAGFGYQWIVEKKGKVEDVGRNDSHLRYAEVDILGSMKILKLFNLKVPPNFIYGKMKQPHSTKLRGNCQGDSGSPLVHGNTVVGILSSSPTTCIELKKGSMYTSVAHYLEFIDLALQDKPHSRIRTFIPQKQTNE